MSGWVSSFPVWLLFSLVVESCGIKPSSGYADKQTATVKSGDTTGSHFEVEAAPGWTGLFDRSEGWFGADGIFSIPCNGVDTAGGSDSTLFIFSDTVIGDIVNDQLKPGWRMVHNSVAYLRGTEPSPDRIRFYWKKDSSGNPVSMFVPRTPAASDSDYYWLGDGFVDQALHNNTYLFAYRIRNVRQGDFGFKEVGNALIVLPKGSKPPFTDQRQIETPFFLPDDGVHGSGSFGAAIFVNTLLAGAPLPDGYVYVYGVRGPQKQVLVARVKPSAFLRFSSWRFWDGKMWNKDIHQVACIADHASNELSLNPIPGGKYALIFQVDGMGSSVGMRIGTSPIGPFGPMIRLWDCPEGKINQAFFTYNAKAHPGISQPGKLLVSYNVNAFHFLEQIKKNPHLYRPRFIQVRFP